MQCDAVKPRLRVGGVELQSKTHDVGAEAGGSRVAVTGLRIVGAFEQGGERGPGCDAGRQERFGEDRELAERRAVSHADVRQAQRMADLVSDRRAVEAVGSSGVVLKGKGNGL